jgi:hypothetical protein
MYAGRELALFCIGMLGQPYWYGTCVYKCTEKLLNSKAKQYPEHYTEGRMDTYRQHIAEGRTGMDCVGMIKGFFWTKGGTEANEYQRDCPDKSANGMFEYARKQGMDWGEIDTMPNEPGICVRFDGHVGVYIGGGNVVEARGFKYGVVQTALAGRPWTHWYKMPGLGYCATESTQTVLRKGARGAQVTRMQELLIRAGYPLPVDGADGDFGEETEGALKEFQWDKGLIINGVCDSVTWHLLETATPNQDGGSPEESTPEDAPQFLVTGDRVNVRIGPGTQYKSVGIVREGDVLMGVDSDDWRAIVQGDTVRWISGKYVKEVR